MNYIADMVTPKAAGHVEAKTACINSLMLFVELYNADVTYT